MQNEEKGGQSAIWPWLSDFGAKDLGVWNQIYILTSDDIFKMGL